ncbi:MAG: ABC transporter permease [Oscillospiraceae bacterium]|nr:ABC transporter permease [Oscillospiraceae bacterium]MDD4414326.1 ABC transporter permease [Oscillospiraceae bacterium]
MKRFFRDLKRYFRYILFSAKSQLKAEVSNSYLNWLWWILEPLCFTVLYVFIFQVLFKSKEQHFPVFVMVGLTVWNYFNKTVKNSVGLIKKNRSVVTRIYVPKFVFVLVDMFVNTFKMLISFGIIFIMMIVFKVPFGLTILYIIPILFVLNVLIFGFNTILMHFGVFVGDLSNIMNILLRFLFYLSGIFYSVRKRVPGIYGKLLLKFNPMAFIINESRNVLLYRKTPDFRFLTAWLVVGLLLSGVGVWIIYKNENSYAKVI